jgi:hypothetical protein
MAFDLKGWLKANYPGPAQHCLSTLPTLAQIKKLAARNKLPPKPQPPAPPPAA